MKNDILNILNQELNRVSDEEEKAKIAQNLTALIAWLEYKKLIKKLIKRLQDEG